MDGHFRAFSFVDRIAAVDPGVRIRGAYAIPPGLEDFPVSLVAEAVGQLAAWAAMAAVDFSHRPVAGIAGIVDLLVPVRPGQTLELTAELESVATELVGYSGVAHVDGVPVIRLQDCVGPMMPLAEFDDPERVRERFHALCDRGARPGGFGGLPSLGIAPNGGEPRQSLQVVLSVPAAAPFFADHFPRRPVFPGTLLMNASLQAAAALAAAGPPPGPDARWMPHTLADAKLRDFIAPGQTLDLEAQLTERSAGALVVAVESRLKGRLIGSVEARFSPEARP